MISSCIYLSPVIDFTNNRDHVNIQFQDLNKQIITQL